MINIQDSFKNLINFLKLYKNSIIEKSDKEILIDSFIKPKI